MGAQINDRSVLTDGAIAGIVIGAIAFALVLLLIVVCLCGTDMRAWCYFNSPCCYNTFCACNHKSAGLNKYYDLFVSYNRKDFKWVEKSLMPRVSNNLRKVYMHHDSDQCDDVYSLLIKEKLENSSHVLLVLSDAYLENEWNDIEFRSLVRFMVENKKIGITCVQMADVTNEELEEYVHSELRVPKLRSLEKNEFCFWNKVKYFLSRDIDRFSTPRYKKIQDSHSQVKKQQPKSNDFFFTNWNIDRPIIELDRALREKKKNDKSRKLHAELDAINEDNLRIGVDEETQRQKKKYKKTRQSKTSTKFQPEVRSMSDGSNEISFGNINTSLVISKNTFSDAHKTSTKNNSEAESLRHKLSSERRMVLPREVVLKNSQNFDINSKN